jgi:hypothetical protein
MDTAYPRLRKQSVVVLTLALVVLLFVMPAASAGQPARRSGVERFLLISTNPSSTGGDPVVAFGPIHAKGVDHPVSDTKDVFRFPAGSLSVTHMRTSSRNASDPVTCLFTFVERGTYRITGGTRAYAHASGQGRYRLTATGIGCKQNAPQVFTLTIRARGPLNLP